MKEEKLQVYNDLFNVDNNTAKYFVLYNTNLTYLLTANEIVTFYQIVHVCNINRNYASLNYLKNLLNMSLNTIKKSISKLVSLKLITRHKNYNSTFSYTLNLESIDYIYNKVNSFHRLEDRKQFCKEYIEECAKTNDIEVSEESTSNSTISKNDTPMSKNDIAISKFDTPVSKNDIDTISKIDTHINKIFNKEDDLNKKNEFNKENESYKEDVAVEKSSKNDMNFDTYFDEIKIAFNTDNIETLTKFEDMFSSKEFFNNLSEEDVSELKFYASDAKQRLQRKLNFDKPADADNSNKVDTSTLNKETTDTSINKTSSNTEQINSADADNSKESINNKNKLNMKQQAKEYFKTVLNEVSRLNRINSTDVSKLKIYYDVIKTLSIDEVDKNEMLDKCSEYINEISSKETANANVTNEVANAETSFNNDNIENKTDIPTLEEKTTDTSIEEISSNTELKNNADAVIPIEEPFDVEKAIKNNMEFQRYYTNINVAFTKRSVATLRLYEKMFSSNVEYLSNREIEELKNLASDAKRKLQVELNIAS